jgi:hypothetical protein
MFNKDTNISQTQIKKPTKNSEFGSEPYRFILESSVGISRKFS